MSDEASSGGRRWIGGVVVVVLAMAGAAVTTILVDEGLDPVVEDPDPPPPRPTVTPAQPRPRPDVVDTRTTQRISLQPPEGHELPNRPDTIELNPLTPDMRREMNYFVDDILKASRNACIMPWLEEIGPGTRSEFVFDAVLVDGEMYDIGVRSLDRELPGEVSGCISDQAWSQEMPKFDFPGEVRLQRSISYQSEG